MKINKKIQHYANASTYTTKDREITIMDNEKAGGYTVRFRRFGVIKEGQSVCSFKTEGGLLITHIGLTAKTIKNLCKLMESRERFLDIPMENGGEWVHHDSITANFKIAYTDYEASEKAVLEKDGNGLPETGWLKLTTGVSEEYPAIIYRTGKITGYGRNAYRQWVGSEEWNFDTHPHFWTPAIDEEVKAMLIEEAKKRYTVPCTVKYLDGSFNNQLNGYDLDFKANTLYASETFDMLMSNGNWAEIIEETEEEPESMQVEDVELPKTGWLHLTGTAVYIHRTGESSGYGRNADGDWSTSITSWTFVAYPETWEVADPDEVLEMLVAEAEKRGLVEGAVYSYTDAPHLESRMISGGLYVKGEYLYNNKHVLMNSSGAWAVVEEEDK